MKVNEENFKKLLDELDQYSTLSLVRVVHQRILNRDQELAASMESVEDANFHKIPMETIPEQDYQENLVPKSVPVTKQSWSAVCATCGIKTSIPFEPKTSAPIYCKACYNKRQGLL